MTTIQWNPIIQSEDIQVYEKKISEIAAALSHHSNEFPSHDMGLFSGKTGIMLFFFYYARLTQDQDYFNLAVEILYEILDQPFGSNGFHAFSVGQAGILWTIIHLVKEKFIEMETDETLGGVAPFIYSAMNRDLGVGHYDYMHGAIGCGLYYLENLHRKEFRGYLEALVDQLDDMCQKEKGGGIKWLGIMDYKEKTGRFDIGMAHGSAGIIVFLARVYEAGIQREKALALIKGAVRYLLDQQIPPTEGNEKHGSLFPKLALESQAPAGSRLAWCYGDLGIGVALWQAGSIIDDAQWKELALKVLTHSAGRRDLGKNHVKDSCLCHGTAGIAHVFGRIYHETGNPLFKETARFWWRKTLGIGTYADGFAGYKSLSSIEDGKVFTKQANFLEGVSGTGLAMISAISNFPPAWDRALLLS